MLANIARGAGHEVRVMVPRVMPNAPAEVIGSTAWGGQEFARLHRTLTEWGPDIVHVQFAIAAFGARTVALMHWLGVLRRDFKAPLIITLHEPTREYASLPTVGGAMLRWLASHSDRLIVHTNIAYKSLVDEVGIRRSKVSVMPQPKVLLPEATSSPSDLRARYELGDARILLAFGFIHADKGLDDLIKALNILRDTRTPLLDNVRLVVAGAVRPRQGLFRAFEVRDKLYFARTLRRARRKAMQEVLDLTGYVPDGEVATWFKVAEAVVLPYRRVDQSGVAWMARALNVPVLSSTVGGLAEEFAGSRWTFPPGAPTQIADAIADFLATGAGRAHLAAEQSLADSGAATKRVLDLYGALLIEKQTGASSAA
jgi:glycosyltransferase involved in cell wall biosynthesis